MTKTYPTKKGPWGGWKKINLSFFHLLIFALVLVSISNINICFMLNQFIYNFYDCKKNTNYFVQENSCRNMINVFLNKAKKSLLQILDIACRFS